MIPVFKPYMGEEEIKAVSEVLKSGWIGLGPLTEKFEEEFARYIGVKYSSGLNSCTAALDVALRLLGINKGDEVIVPTITFVSTAHAVAYNFATPIFCDVDEKTLCIDPKDIERKITKRTKAIVPVHYSGRPCNIDEIKKIANGIPIIEDVAHGCGGTYKGKKLGSLGDIGCFSFHAVKNLAMGDGGALTFENKAYYERAIKIRWLGIDKSTWSRTGVDKSYWWQYNVEEIGLKCHMNDIIASIGLVQLKKLDKMNQRRKEIVELYNKGLKDIPQIELPPQDTKDSISSWHIYCIKCEKRNELSTFLQENDICTGVHYYPIHLYPCYGNLTSLPNAEKVFPKILSLPIYPALSDEEVSMIIDKIGNFYKKN